MPPVRAMSDRAHPAVAAVQRHNRAAAARADQIQRLVVHDAQQPRPEAATLEARNRPVCRDERLLRRIVGQIWIAQHAPRVGEDRLLMAAYQFRERPSIPIPRPVRELIVVRVHRPCHTRAGTTSMTPFSTMSMDRTEVSDVG